jgi:hypothetical protein
MDEVEPERSKSLPKYVQFHVSSFISFFRFSFSFLRLSFPTSSSGLMLQA